jgi:glycosyltransferase involved in cell wall biosynthesis
MPKVLYFISEDWYFCSHRLPIARAVRDAGWDVVVVARENQHGDIIRNEGFKYYPLPLERGGINPLKDLSIIRRFISILNREQPDILHAVALKPVIYGAWAARKVGIKHGVYALAGMGFVFLSTTLKARVLRPFIRMMLKQCDSDGSCVLVQNDDDASLMKKSVGISENRISVVRGSGVDTSIMTTLPEPDGQPIICTLVARMLWDKGVGEFVEAIRQLREQGLDIEGWLVGGVDVDNPAGIPELKLREWEQEGVIKFLGHQTDIVSIWQQAHIAVLPSYREGLPKSLLEAASCGRPMVATDVPGCREIVIDGETGVLVEARNASSLAGGIAKLAESPELRKRYGINARQLVEESFAMSHVTKSTLNLYQELLS